MPARRAIVDSGGVAPLTELSQKAEGAWLRSQAVGALKSELSPFSFQAARRVLGLSAGKTAAETAAALDLPARYANYAMSRGTLTSAEDNATKIYAELDR